MSGFKIFIVTWLYFLEPATCTATNFTSKRTADDDYYLNDYDYEISNFSDKTESLLLPNPETIDSKYTVDVLPNVELPDDSLADTDLKDHDFIDNLMYVYYGSHNRNDGNSSRPVVIIIGSVLSCAAQLLTIFCVLLKKKLNGNRKDMKNIFLHMMGSFCVSNLLFMLGVYAVRSWFQCLVIALTLHYLHLLTAFWMFLYCFYIYKRFSSSAILKHKYFLCVGYGLPLLLTMFSYLVAPQSFETKRFCFISVHRGMLVNYMIPVFLLIIGTTVSALYGIQEISTELSKLELNSSAESLNAIRHELDMICDERQDGSIDEEVVSLKESRTCLRLLCAVQTGYDIVWFIVVLALDNDAENNTMALIYSVTSCILNWYIFLKTKSFLPTLSGMARMENISLQGDHDKSDSSLPNSRRGSSDNVPLLINMDNGTELKELRLNYISTISN